VRAVAIGRVGEPDRAVDMRHDGVWRVERLSVIGIRDDGHRAVMLPAHNPSVFPDVAVLNVAGHIAEDEVLPLARPSRAFRPIGAGPYAADRSVPQSHGV